MPRSSHNIAARFSQTALSVPRQTAVIAGGRRLTFKELEDDCDALAWGLEKMGVRAGALAAVMVPPGVDFIALTFALFKLGAVPVLIDPGIGWKSLKTCLAEAQPEVFIGSALAHAARVAGGWAKGTLRLHVTTGFFGGRGVGEARRLGSGLGPRPPAAAGADETAAILFTSGSTGAPKGAIYTHAIFGAQLELLRDHFGIRPGETSVPTFPLFALFDAALGMTVVIPDMDATRPGSVDPRRIIEPIARNEAAQLFGSPALIDRVGRFGQALPSIKRVISAGAPVPPRVVARLAGLLPADAVIHTPYGATEALPVSCIESAELAKTAELTAQGRGVCVGRPVPGMEVFIIRISDEPILRWSDDLLMPDGEIGEIAVKGPVVTRGYFHRPEATLLAKIGGPRASLFHRMGDLGYKDELGRLWFCGRKSQRVITPEGTLFTIPCEGVFNRHEKVKRSALVGVRGAPVLCVEREPGPGDERALREELLALGSAHAHTKNIKTILFHRAFPVDIRHNAKIFREKLAVWAAGKMS